MSGKLICDSKPDPTFDVSGLLADRGSACVVAHSLAMLDLARRRSCGKCVFCREGTLQLYEILKDATGGGGAPEDLELLAEISAAVRDYAGCDMASAAATGLAALLAAYPDEFEEHIKRKRCRALECQAYYTVHVLPDKCVGCGACAAACPEGAIAGGAGLVHVIDQETCTRCGACLEACAAVADAVVKAGPVKPRTPEAPIPVGGWGEEAGGRRRRRRGSDNEDGGSDV